MGVDPQSHREAPESGRAGTIPKEGDSTRRTGGTGGGRERGRARVCPPPRSGVTPRTGVSHRLTPGIAGRPGTEYLAAQDGLRGGENPRPEGAGQESPGQRPGSGLPTCIEFFHFSALKGRHNEKALALPRFKVCDAPPGRGEEGGVRGFA